MSRPDHRRFEVRPYQPGDEESILALHGRAFAGHPVRTLEHWYWKFRDNPLGRTDLMLAVEPGGDCVAVYAGLRHPAVLEGEPIVAGLHVDVAVDRHVRSGLSGARLLVEVMRRYFAEYAGGDTRLTWGFPEPSLHRVGLRFVRFHVLRDVVFLVREAGGAPAAGEGLETRSVERFDGDVDSLWSGGATGVRTGLVRDTRYLNWRYADHPDRPHFLFEARDREGALRGVAVAREGGWDDALLSIMDWLVPVDDVDAERALVRAVCECAVTNGRSWVGGWLAGDPLRFRRWQTEHGFFAQITPYQECFRSWQPGATRRHLGETWYQTTGDIDFF